MNLLTFRPGGLHLQGLKEKTANLPIENMPEPSFVVIPLLQHTGLPAKPIVKVSDVVKIGQKIGEAQGDFSVPIHASISGEVVEVTNYAIKIKNDYLSDWFVEPVREEKTLFEKEKVLRDSLINLWSIYGSKVPTTYEEELKVIRKQIS